MNIDDVQKVKLEDGDILLVTVPIDYTPAQISLVRSKLTEDVQGIHGDKCLVYVFAVRPGEASMSIAKRNELSDIRQLIDDLDSRVDELETEQGR